MVALARRPCGEQPAARCGNQFTEAVVEWALSA